MVVGETQLAATRPTVPRGRRAYALTAPPNLNGKKGSTLKRDAPTVWELQNSMSAHRAREQVEAQASRLPVAPSTWGRAQSSASISTMAESEGNMTIDDDGGERDGSCSSSWPRVRKQRTGDRNSMSLWEVSDALDGAGPQQLPSPLPSPNNLDARALADLGADLSFVDNMFFSHAPPLAAAAPVLAPPKREVFIRRNDSLSELGAPEAAGRGEGWGLVSWECLLSRALALGWTRGRAPCADALLTRARCARQAAR